MDTIAVHAGLLSLTEREGAVAPSLWTHDLAGPSLTYQFAGSDNTFTWNADALASMPDRFDYQVLVDHDADRMTLLWSEPKVALEIVP